MGERPIRVLHVLHSFGTGGMEKGVATLVRHGSPRFEHTIICLDRSGASERLLPEDTAVHELGKPPGQSLRFLVRLARVLRSQRPTLVHTRNWGGMDGIVASRLAGIRSVVHGEHGWGMDDPHGALARRIRARRFLSRWVRAFTCVSRQMERWLVETVRVRAPVRQIYNAVDLTTYGAPVDRAAVRAELGIDPGQFVAMTCGRFDPIKDHPTLFRAFAAFRTACAGGRLLVVGEGPERSTIERLAGPGVELLGERRDVPRLLGACDVFVLSSLNEGISNTILEAMGAGLPVIATDVGGNPELVRDGATGRLVPPGDVEAIADALVHYASEPERARAEGLAGRRRVAEEFGVERMVSAYEAVYDRVVPPARI